MFLAIFTLFFTSCNNTPSVSNAMFQGDSVVIHKPLSETQKEYYQHQILPVYNNVLVNSGFNGGIIIAKNGEVIFEDYKGVINYKTKEPITSNSPFHIASVSKTFTAMAVLKLMENGKVNIDADVRNYLPSFPYFNITVKNLLNHRSGLPNYVRLMNGTISETFRKKNKRGRWVTYTKTKKDNNVKEGFVSNEDVLNFLVKRKPFIEALPNKKFNYCNTNYVLLALIIETVSGKSYPDFMKETFFEPLGMKDSYVFCSNNITKYVPSYKYNFVPYGLEKLDCVYGDKNIYSTPRDILQWDKAIYANKVVSQNSLEKAFTPYSNERPGTHNYGLGWRLLTFPTYTIPYHNGWWHGNNAVFTRLVKDSATIIVLGNKFNPRIYKAKEFASIFSNSADSLVVEE